MIWPADLNAPRARALEAELTGADPLAAISAVRRAHPEIDPALVSAVATQARLRARARPRLHPWADDLVLSDAGLQQASRSAVALYRGAELTRRLGRSRGTVADLGCGLGIDALGMAAAGFTVRAFEQDAWTAQAAQINTLLANGRVTVQCLNATDADLADCDAAFCDPARRDADGPANARGTRTPAQSDPDQWSPPWSWVRDLAERMPVVAKAAPGLASSYVPPDAEREWIDCEGTLVETCVWFPPLAGAGRRATAIDPGGIASLCDDDPSSDAAAAVGATLIEASAAVVRADLVPALAARLDIARVHGSRRWLTSPDPIDSPLARTWHVIRELPDDPRELRAALRERGSATWKTADIDISAEEMSRRIGHRAARDGAAMTVAWVRVADGVRAYEVTR